MARIFDKNMFVMLLSIMVGVVVITFFVADIMKNTALEKQAEEYEVEIEDIQTRNINLLSNILSSIGDLIRSNNYRTEGNYHFDLATIWYSTVLSETNLTEMEYYKSLIYSACDDASFNYNLSKVNYEVAHLKFQSVLSQSTEEFEELLTLYVNLTAKGSELAELRIDASKYLRYLTENITIINNTVAFENNMTDIQDLLNSTLNDIEELEMQYAEIEEEIEKEYNIIGFSEIREIEIG